MDSAKWLSWIVVALVVIVGGWFVLSRPASVDTGTGPIKIGVVLPLTGEAAAYGEPGRNILQIAADKINGEGGINGQNIELIVEDGKCDGAGAANATQKLINVDKVQVIIGGFCSSESLSAVPIATQAKVALFSPGSSNPKLTGISPYFTRNCPSDSAQGEVLAGVASDKGVKKMAVIQEQTDYAVGLYGSFNTSFSAKGGVVAKEEFASNQTDLRTALTKLRSSNSDALFIIVQTPAAAERVMKQIRNLGWKPQLYVNEIVSGFSDLIAANTDLLQGAVSAEFTANTENPKFKEMLSAYKTKYGKEPPLLSYAQTEYDSLFILADAIRAVGNDGTKVTNWLHQNVNNWQGATGSVTIGSNGDLVAGHRPEVFSNGKFVPLQ